MCYYGGTLTAHVKSSDETRNFYMAVYRSSGGHPTGRRLGLSLTLRIRPVD